MSKYYKILLILILIAWGCKPTTSYKIRDFFFDGVPNLKDKLLTEKTDSINNTANDSVKLSSNESTTKLFRSVHSPYVKRECYNCHDENQRAKKMLPLNGLCFNCHENPNNLYSSLHGPVESENCTACHDPHKSQFKSLLKFEGNELCFNCHNNADVFDNRIHSTIEDKSCTTCHKPHGANRKLFLDETSCFQCHEDFTKGQDFIHGPVEGNLCGSCHLTHESKNNKLLVYQGDDLCLNCHTTMGNHYIATNKKSPKQECTSCHDPHSGINKYQLINAMPN